MREFLKVFAITLIFITTFLNAESIEILTKKDLEKIQNEFPKQLNYPGFQLLKGVNHGKFIQVEGIISSRKGTQKLEFFIVDALKEVLFFGSAYDKDAILFEIPKNKKVIENGVAFKVGTGKENLYIVTDPECRPCRRLEEAITEDVLKKYTVNIILYPLSFHKNAKQMLYWVLNAKTKPAQAKRYHKVVMGDLSYKKFHATQIDIQKAEKILDNSKKAANELNIIGTPSVFNSNFDHIQGF